MNMIKKNTSKLKSNKSKSKIVKRPLSYIDKKVKSSKNKNIFDLSLKLSGIKTPFFQRINMNQNNNEISKDQLTERKLNNNLQNLSFKQFKKDNISTPGQKYFKKIETPKKLVCNKIQEKINNDINDIGLSELIVINNQSIPQKKEINLKKLLKDNSTKSICSPRLYNKKNLLHKSFYNRKYNSFNNQVKEKNKKIYNNFVDSKKDLIRKRIINSANRNYNYNIDNVSIDTIKTNSITYKTLLYNSERNKNIIDNKINQLNLNNNDNTDEEIKLNINNEEADSLKIKNKYMIKFGEMVEIYKKLILNADCVRIDFRNTFSNIMTNVYKSFEEYNKIILFKYESGIAFSVDIWSNSLRAFYNFCDEMLKWQKMMIDEIRFIKRENIRLNKRKFFIENELNIKDKEIKDINNNIIKYDLNKVKNGKIECKKIDKIKNDYVNHESNYVLTIYQLENELKQLSELLNQNKIEKKIFDELTLKLNTIRKEYDRNQADYKEYEFQSNHQIILLTQYNNELNQKINKYDKDMKEFKERELGYMENIVILKSKIEYLNNIVNEKDTYIGKLKIEINKLTDIRNAQMLGPVKTVFVPGK